MGRLLAIDYGLKRVGIAVTDPLQLIPNALETVAQVEIFSYLKNYCMQEEVDAFIVGDPKNLDNTPSEIANAVNLFINQLQALFPAKKVFRIDERFTSKMAAKALFDAGYKKKFRRDKNNIDKISAVILLQNYLEIKQQS